MYTVCMCLVAMYIAIFSSWHVDHMLDVRSLVYIMDLDKHTYMQESNQSIKQGSLNRMVNWNDGMVDWNGNGMVEWLAI